MHTVEYTHRIQYRTLPKHGRSFPVLDVQLSHNEQSIDVITVVDTGAEFTLISGGYAMGIGLDLQSGRKGELHTLGGSIVYWSHNVKVNIFDIFIEIEIRFSEQSIPRNLLGRDLLEYMRIGLREKHESLFCHTQG